jgi:hypothetical protein
MVAARRSRQQFLPQVNPVECESSSFDFSSTWLPPYADISMMCQPRNQWHLSPNTSRVEHSSFTYSGKYGCASVSNHHHVRIPLKLSRHTFRLALAASTLASFTSSSKSPIDSLIHALILGSVVLTPSCCRLSGPSLPTHPRNRVIG